jgi:hypothetical protein
MTDEDGDSARWTIGMGTTHNGPCQEVRVKADSNALMGPIVSADADDGTSEMKYWHYRDGPDGGYINFQYIGK